MTDAASDTDEDLLIPEEVARRLRTTPKTLTYWRGIDHGPQSFKLSEREIRYRREDVERWLARCIASSGRGGAG